MLAWKASGGKTNFFTRASEVSEGPAEHGMASVSTDEEDFASLSVVYSLHKIRIKEAGEVFSK